MRKRENHGLRDPLVLILYVQCQVDLSQETGLLPDQDLAYGSEEPALLTTSSDAP